MYITLVREHGVEIHDRGMHQLLVCYELSCECKNIYIYIYIDIDIW